MNKKQSQDISLILEKAIAKCGQDVRDALRENPVCVKELQLRPAVVAIRRANREFIYYKRGMASLTDMVRRYQSLCPDTQIILPPAARHDRLFPIDVKNPWQIQWVDSVIQSFRDFVGWQSITEDAWKGAALLAAIVFDGIWDPEALVALADQWQEPWRIDRNTSYAYKDLRMAHQSGGRILIRRWWLREETESIVRRVPKAILVEIPCIPIYTQLFNLIQSFLGVLEITLPGRQTLAALLGAFWAWGMSKLAPADVFYATGETSTSPVRHDAFLRLQLLRQKEDHATAGMGPSENLPVFSEEELWEEAFPLATVDRLRGALRSPSRSEALKVLDKAPSDGLDEASALAEAFARHLLRTPTRRSPDGYQPVTVRNLVLGVLGQIFANGLTEGLFVKDSESRLAIYVELVELVPDIHRRVKLAHGLVIFDDFLVVDRGHEPIDWHRIEQFASLLSPVDANILSVDDIEAAINLLTLRESQYKEGVADILKAVIILCFYGGLRTLEAIGLRTSNLHPSESPVLRIFANDFRGMKTGNAERKVPVGALLPARHLTFLLDLRQRRMDVARAAGSPTGHCFLLGLPESTNVYSPDAVIHWCNMILREVTGDSRAHLYALRHSFVTLNGYGLYAGTRQTCSSRFSLLPKTQQFLEGSRQKRVALGLDADGSKADLRMHSRSVGHWCPETTLDSYFHCADWILQDEMADAVPVTPTELARISGLPVASVHRKRGQGRAEFLTYLRASGTTGMTFEQPAISAPSTERAESSHNVAAIEASSVWDVLGSLHAGHSLDDVTTHLGIDPQRAIAMVEAAHEMAGIPHTHEPADALDPVAFERVLKFPVARNDKAFVRRLANALTTDARFDQGAFSALRWADANTWRSNNLLILRSKKDVDIAVQYVSFLEKNGISPANGLELVTFNGVVPTYMNTLRNRLGMASDHPLRNKIRPGASRKWLALRLNPTGVSSKTIGIAIRLALITLLCT